jgi:hypothetical protein
MKKEDFIFNEELKHYGLETDDYEVIINEKDMSDEILKFAESVVKAYPQKVVDIAHYIAEELDTEEMFGIAENEITEKLHEPSIKIFSWNGNFDGMITYCNHELDEDHLIDVEFSGVLEEFDSVSIDG